ncbi:EamA family transporter RarD [Streptococcus ratti]|uniref:RarD protein n=1 Tax=Streptococcus ratti FA-1 = DSM 20564 TaxID=699248 RepID=A0ABN0GU40_STRRT|nr:EamA family transporter RarD [Streptococcus ratti]EJN93837.1 rarD protein [Streptococcus ratti FA-1 = DSM 20564]EMP69109.1 RarD protein [Streptococcus ratti FA-1 = DSM 20564]QEY07685.1 EamA family transporter RarD [Streptococcus ratti]VEI60146.1 chloramphenicol-sensitive protein RarD [Streptococcus mutans]
MKETRQGLLFGLGAYVLWGVISLFWKQLSGVNPYAIFSYRILWTLITMLLYMFLSRRQTAYKKQLSELLADKKARRNIILASFLIAINWLSYIYAVTNQQATQASLGYYVMPLVSVLLSLIFLRERLDRWTVCSVLLAAFGVVILILNTGRAPFITFLLAFSFAFYGLIKKNIKLSSDTAMLVEAAVIAPLALVYLFFFSNENLFDYSLWENILLAASGFITAVPLLLFAEGVKRAPLNLIGFIQYINPTMQLLIAVLIFGEAITLGELRGFIFIWLAVFIFITGQILMLRKSR